MSPTSPSSWVQALPYTNTAPRAVPTEHHRSLTVGEWATEQESAAVFDAAVGDRWWTVYREVSGVLLQPRPAQTDGALRIDRVLIPKKPLIDAGWKHGAIGVELKRSGEKIGPPISQAIDYSRGAFTIPRFGGVRVVLDWVFIWPVASQGGTTASLMAQNRLGSAEPVGRSYAPSVRFKPGSQPALIEIGWDGGIVEHWNGKKVDAAEYGKSRGRR